MNTLFWSFLANFGYLRLILGRKSQKNTFSNYLGAKRTIESKKVGPFGYFKNRAPKVTQKPPWAKKTLKRPQEGQNWHQCFSCGTTNYFWAKKTNSNRTPQRSVPFTWNQPVAGGLVTQGIIVENMALKVFSKREGQ